MIGGGSAPLGAKGVAETTPNGVWGWPSHVPLGAQRVATIFFFSFFFFLKNYYFYFF
jgi:hypothetical protein